MFTKKTPRQLYVARKLQETKRQDWIDRLIMRWYPNK